MKEPVGATRTLAAWIVDRARPAPTEAALAIARLSVLDTVACALAAVCEPGPWALKATCRVDADLPASVWGMGTGAGPRDAALLNGMLSHMLDFDDGDMVSRMHPSCMLVPALFAAAELHKMTGAAVLDAYLTGYYVIQLIGRIAGKPLARRGFHVTGLIGAMGTTAALCRLLKLSADQTAVALGITASTVGGLRGNFGTDMKPYHAGRAAACALEAVDMTRAGVTASRDILEAKDGFLWVLGEPGLAEMIAPEVTRLIEGRYSIELEPPNIKLYACCHATHANIQAILQLRPQLVGRLDSIREIIADAPHTAAIYVIYSQPRTGLEGKFSMEAALAIALIDGRAGVPQFTDEAIRRADVQALSRKVKFTTSDRMEEIHGRWKMPGSVEVTTDEGRLFAEVDDARGCRSAPCSLDDVSAKFRECAAGVLAESDIEAVLSALQALDTLPDIGAVTAKLRGGRVHAPQMQQGE